MLRLALYSAITQRGDCSLRKVHMKHPPHHKSRTINKLVKIKDRPTDMSAEWICFNFSS